MLSILTDPRETNIKLHGLEFLLEKPNGRSEMIWPYRLYGGTCQIDYKIMFPEMMPSGWCVVLQFIQATKENGGQNPTFQMNVDGSDVQFKHKTTLVGPGPIFCNTSYEVGVEDHYRIIVEGSRTPRYGHISVAKNGVEIGRIDGQTYVDVEEQPLLKYGLYCGTEWPAGYKRKSIVTELEMTTINANN